MCLCRMPCTLKNVEEVRSCNHMCSVPRVRYTKKNNIKSVTIVRRRNAFLFKVMTSMGTLRRSECEATRRYCIYFLAETISKSNLSLASMHKKLTITTPTLADEDSLQSTIMFKNHS